MTRFGVSMNSNLLQKFDKLIHRKGYTNRSEAIRDLIRKAIVEDDKSLADYDDYLREVEFDLDIKSEKNYFAIEKELARKASEIAKARGISSKNIAEFMDTGKGLYSIIRFSRGAFIMIKNRKELKICIRRLLKLQNMFEKVITNHEKKRRVKDIELAGISEMIKQLQDEIRIYQR